MFINNNIINIATFVQKITMNEKIEESLHFLLAEYKRLRKKKENTKLTNLEEETLKNLSKFVGKNK